MQSRAGQRRRETTTSEWKWMEKDRELSASCDPTSPHCQSDRSNNPINNDVSQWILIRDKISVLFVFCYDYVLYIFPFNKLVSRVLCPLNVSTYGVLVRYKMKALLRMPPHFFGGASHSLSHPLCNPNSVLVGPISFDPQKQAKWTREVSRTHLVSPIWFEAERSATHCLGESWR